MSGPANAPRPHDERCAPARISPAECVAAVAIVAVAAGVRVHAIDALEVWVDEANSYLTARRPIPEMLRALELDSSPPGYYVAMHCWIAWFGDSVAALRMLSVTASVALTAAVYLVGRRAFSPGAGLWAAAFVAVSPVQVFYAQQIRMYPWLSLFALGSVWFLVRYLGSGDRRWLVACWLASIAALYTHNFALYAMLVLAAVVACSGQLVSRWKAWGGSALVIGAAYAPWLPSFLRQLGNHDHYAWYQPVWEIHGVWGTVANTFRSWSPAAEFVMFEHRGVPAHPGWPALLGVGLAALGAVALYRRARVRSGGAGPQSWAWAPIAVLLPIVASLGASVLLSPHYVSGRVDQMMFPMWAILVGVGAASLRPVAVPVALLAGVAWLGLSTLDTFRTDYREHGYRGSDRALAAAVREVWRPGDVVVTTSLSRASLEYYLRDLDLPLISFPRETAAHLGAQNDRRLNEDREALRREARVVVNLARQRAGPGGRLLLLRSVLPANDALAPDALHNRYSVELLDNLGRFAQVGTEDRIWLSVHRLKLGGAGP